MTNFVLRESEYEKVCDLLIREVQGFYDSLEFERVAEEERKVSGLVCGAFSKFFVRFQEEEIRAGLNERNAKSLDDAYRAIEALSASQELNVQNVVVNEVFENLECGPAVLEAIKSRLGPKSKELYSRWIE